MRALDKTKQKTRAVRAKLRVMLRVWLRVMLRVTLRVMLRDTQRFMLRETRRVMQREKPMANLGESTQFLIWLMAQDWVANRQNEKNQFFLEIPKTCIYDSIWGYGSFRTNSFAKRN